MKNYFKLFIATCVTAVLLSSCASIDEYGFTTSITPVVTNGTWKVNSYVSSNTNQTTDFSGYQLSFNGSGTFTATKNGVIETGAWAEDNISKKVSIAVTTTDPVLDRLNDTWNVIDISTTEVRFDSEKTAAVHLNITNL